MSFVLSISGSINLKLFLNFSVLVPLTLLSVLPPLRSQGLKQTGYSQALTTSKFWCLTVRSLVTFMCCNIHVLCCKRLNAYRLTFPQPGSTVILVFSPQTSINVCLLFSIIVFVACVCMGPAACCIISVTSLFRKTETTLLDTVKIKASNTRYRASGQELIPVYRQSARR